MDKTKRGIVLFITLSVIVAMMSIMGVMFSYLEQSRERASHTSALIQANLLYRDSKNVIESLLKQAGDNKEMKKGILNTLYLAPVSMQTKDTKNFVTLTCRPLDNGVNINWLGIAQDDEKNQKFLQLAQKLYDAIVVAHEINDASALLLKIVQKSNFQSQNRQKKGIISLSQFKDIVREYSYESDDTSAMSVPWGRYFSFDDKSEIINANYLSAESIALLFDLELESIKDEWIEGEDLKQFLDSQGGTTANYNNKIFATDTPERMGCHLTYSYQEQSYAFEFKYLEGRATEFDFFAKQ